MNLSCRREQIQIEDEVRRKYGKRWGEVSNQKNTRHYNSEFVDKFLQEIPNSGEFCVIEFSIILNYFYVNNHLQ